MVASLAFVTWDDTGRGHVWKVPASGGAPVRLTKDAGRLRRSGVESRRTLGDRRARRRRDGATAHAHAQRVVRSRSHLGDAAGRRRHRRRARDDHASDRARRSPANRGGRWCGRRVGPDGRIFWVDEVAGHRAAGAVARR